MLGERANFWRFERHAGENRDGVEENRDRRSIGDAAVMSDQDFGLVCGLVVVRRFDESDLVSKVRSALRALDRVLGGLGAGSGDEALPLPGCVADRRSGCRPSRCARARPTRRSSRARRIRRLRSSCSARCCTSRRRARLRRPPRTASSMRDIRHPGPRISLPSSYVLRCPMRARCPDANPGGRRLQGADRATP